MAALHSSGDQWYCSLQQPTEGQPSELKRKTELQGCGHGARPIREAWDVALARDWLDADENKEIRVYLLKNILPTLIPCLEKLLREAEARGEVARGSATEESEAAPQHSFNPLNFLAHNLMRTSPPPWSSCQIIHLCGAPYCHSAGPYYHLGLELTVQELQRSMGGERDGSSRVSQLQQQVKEHRLEEHSLHREAQGTAGPTAGTPDKEHPM
ncbi:uncharacterized protein [Paramormyrops kingsleyae]|uniref:uncharacterized protein isoform X2 n=1 Tax=Paramormyrops kingsleyae TaxID=1676925 RepID=UPI000CD5FB89|nr:uncharacterized protein LOC111861016 isoform X2 [Paramormyrops kingsleyae]